jgi:diguanylate cyclase (GGDEF)-like protein
MMSIPQRPDAPTASTGSTAATVSPAPPAGSHLGQAKPAGADSHASPVGLRAARQVSISTQISRVVVSTAALAVGLTMLVMIVVAMVLAQGASKDRAQIIAELIAANSAVPLVLRDAARGQELLSALSAAQGVMRARLTDRTGSLLGTYESPPPAVGADEDRWLGVMASMSEITVKSKVVDGGDLLGFVEVTVREQQLARWLLRFVISGGAVLALMLLMWWLISGPVGRRLSQPLTQFAEVTRKIRDTGEFTHRLPATHVAEVRRLSEDFNAMLDVIQRRTVEVQERNKELAQLAFYDPLTGAANRVLLLDRMTQLIDAFGRGGHPFAVIGLDLDNFKLLNDQLGHQVGDNFLKVMSKRCQSELRRIDTFARLGGDEFIALLPDVSSMDDALGVARKLSAAVHASNHVHSLPISCTASLGVGLYPNDGKSTNELIARVDAAMYEAKARGRDQICQVSDVIDRPQPEMFDES